MPLYTHKTLPPDDSDWRTVPTPSAKRLDDNRYSATQTANNLAKARKNKKKARKRKNKAETKKNQNEEKRYQVMLNDFGEDHEYQPVTREGLGAYIDDTTEWKTSITWKPADPKTKDGTGVTATCLGPDHKQGTKPNDNAGAHATVLRQKTGHPYKKGHLLNHQVGGPGEDNRNLTAITSSANTVMENQVESPIKSLVNDKYGWVYFKADVQHAFDDNLKVKYAKTLTFDWHQLKNDGQGKATMIRESAANVVINEPSPTTMKSGGSGAKKATVTPRDPMESKRHPEAAVAQLPLDSIILFPVNIELRRRQKDLKRTEDILTKEGQDAMKTITNTICQLLDPPSTPETRTLELGIQARGAEIARLSTSLDDLLEKPKKVEEKRGEKQHEALGGLRQLFNKNASAKANKLMKRVEVALEAHNPSATWTPIMDGLIGRDRAQEEHLMYVLTRQPHGIAAKVEPKGAGKRPHRPIKGDRRSSDEVGSRKQRKVVREASRDCSAELMAGALIKIRDEGIDWTKAKSLADAPPDLHQLATFLVEGSFDQAFLKSSFEGHSKSNQNFPVYLQKLAEIPGLKMPSPGSEPRSRRG